MNFPSFIFNSIRRGLFRSGHYGLFKDNSLEPLGALGPLKTYPISPRTMLESIAKRLIFSVSFQISLTLDLIVCTINEVNKRGKFRKTQA